MLKYLFGQRSSYLDGQTIDKVQSLCRSIENQIDKNNLHQQFVQLFSRLLNSQSKKSARTILQEQMNFSLNKGLSQTHDQGVFLDYGQIDNPGQLVAIYPGTIYRRHFDPLLLPSIRNTFLLARKDDFIIDGRDRGLSRSIYLSCHARYPLYDKTWLLKDIYQHKNPLTLGHYINHFPSNGLPNVTYYEYDFYFNQNEYDFYRLVPHVRYSDIDDEDGKGMPSTVLISLRPIKQGEELFSCYLNIYQMNHYRILIIAGMGCSPVRRCNWYEWLEKELLKKGFNVILEQMPDPYAARESYWLPFIRETLKVDKDTILIGHSSGCQAIMRLIEKDKVHGVILVSACHTDLGMEIERASEYYNRPWNWDAMRENTDWIVQLQSPTDPLIPIEEGRFVAEKLKAEYIELKYAGHFMAKEIPEVFKAIEEKCLQ